MLLIDAEMPEDCYYCSFYDCDYDWCKLLGCYLNSGKPEDCPLVEVDVVPISAEIVCEKGSPKDDMDYIRPYLHHLLTTRMATEYGDVNISKNDIPELPGLVRFTATKNVIIPKKGGND